jgi:methylenetetrahydrofolate reductase (NADPH)
MSAAASGLADLLASQPLTVDLEILPPQNPRFFAVVRRRAATLTLRLGAVNVISRPDRMTSLDASLHLQARGWEPVWHLVARGRTREAVEADLERAAAGGVANVLCLFGDAGAGARGHFSTFELIRAVAARGFFAGAAVDLNHVTLERAEADAVRKVAAGARFLQLQISYDYTKLLAFAARLAERLPDPPYILASTMPVLSAEQVREIPRRLQVEMPTAIERRLLGAADPCGEGICLLEEGAISLRECPVVQGLTLMFLEPDEAPETVARVQDALLMRLPHLAPVEAV